MIDALDKKILNVLIDNSRLSYRQIAKQLKVSVATVMNRVNALHKSGVIERYTTDINLDKIGYELKVIVNVRISKGRLFDVENKISAKKGVYGVYDTTGEFDCLVLARFKNRKAMDNFIKEVQSLQFVERTYTSLVLNTIKERQDRI